MRLETRGVWAAGRQGLPGAAAGDGARLVLRAR